MRLTVKELCSLCADEVCIYTFVEHCDPDFYSDISELFKGNRNNIPDFLLHKEVKNFGALRKNVVDICI